MRLSFALATLPLALLAGCVTGSATTTAAPQISLPTLQRVTQTLSSDEYQGRAPGTEGETRTVALLAQEFRRAGLEPGNNGSWHQDVPLVEITLQGSPALRVTGPNNTNLNFAYRTDYIGASYRARPNVAVVNSDIIFVGYGINAPELDWNDYAGVDVRGKTVVILVNDPGLAEPGPRRHVQRPGDDLLWPLDLQVRGSGPAGRGGRAHRARHGAGLLWLGDRREQLVGPAALHAVRQWRRRPDRDERLAAECRRAPPARRRRLRSGRPPARGARTRLPGGAANRPQGVGGDDQQPAHTPPRAT